MVCSRQNLPYHLPAADGDGPIERVVHVRIGAVPQAVEDGRGQVFGADLAIARLGADADASAGIDTGKIEFVDLGLRDRDGGP